MTENVIRWKEKLFRINFLFVFFLLIFSKLLGSSLPCLSYLDTHLVSITHWNGVESVALRTSQNRLFTPIERLRCGRPRPYWRPGPYWSAHRDAVEPELF